MKINRFIISTNENENYIHCWPIVSQITKKLFNCPSTLAFITNRNNDDSLVKKFKQFGDVVLFTPIEGIPTGNQAKVARMYLATKYQDEICVINDVDIMPLQSNFLTNKVLPIENNKIVAIGANAYRNTKDDGKFPMIYTTALGKTFEEVINPKKMSYKDLLLSWKHTKQIDGKEIISNSPDKFSDESLLRSLISDWKERDDRVVYLNRNFDGYKAVERIDRINWSVDINKLKKWWYIDAHLPRPLNTNMSKIIPLLEFFQIKDYRI